MTRCPCHWCANAPSNKAQIQKVVAVSTREAHMHSSYRTSASCEHRKKNAYLNSQRRCWFGTMCPYGVRCAFYHPPIQSLLSDAGLPKCYVLSGPREFILNRSAPGGASVITRSDRTTTSSSSSRGTPSIYLPSPSLMPFNGQDKRIHSNDPTSPMANHYAD
jgi:hypothetical protein